MVQKKWQMRINAAPRSCQTGNMRIYREKAGPKARLRKRHPSCSLPLFLHRFELNVYENFIADDKAAVV